MLFDRDPGFRDFNFSVRRDPTLQRGPTEAELIELVLLSRRGDAEALADLADAMFHTLRPEAFEAYQRFRGPVGFIFYEDWFYHKLDKFIDILLYDSASVTGFANGQPIDYGCGLTITSFSCWGDVVQPDEVEDAVHPEDNDPRLWYDLVTTVSKAAANRVQAVQDWLESRRQASRFTRGRQSGWTKNQERDNVIRHGLARGMERSEICRELDKRAITTIPALQARGLYKWLDGWADDQGRKQIQSLFSKRKPS